MSVARACLPCRNAKARCDLTRPACGRCRRRGFACSGFPQDVGFIFRDENEAARRNSQRARAEARENPTRPIPMEVIATQEQQTQASTDRPDPFFQQLYPWLNDRALAEVPQPLKRDLCGRAVDRFFINWTLHPCNDEASPGHMQDLSTLYLSAPPESVLWLTVRAMAFADMRDHRDGDLPFSTKALQNYGAALNRLRTITNDEQRLTDDRVLAALLLIDSFESMYLGRTEPLGAHSDAVRHVLQARGDDQFFDRSRFSLWRVAHQRLQARQILLREEPYPEQNAWLSKLDISFTPLHISADVQQMNALAAAAKKLTHDGELTNVSLVEKIERAGHLVRAMQDLITSIMGWTAAMTKAWSPEVIDPNNVLRPWEMDVSSMFPIPSFTCPQVLSYHDVWLSYMWNFHAASQIVLRESFVDVINFIAAMQARQPNEEEVDLIQHEQDAVNGLSATIIRSFPQLLGFVHKDTRAPNSLPQGTMAGRFFSLFSMNVVQRSRFAPPEHKKTAAEVMAWINSTHGLG